MNEITTRIKTSHFWGIEMPVATLLRTFASQENNDGDEANAMIAAGDLLNALYEISESAPELNMSNYSDDDVSRLNSAMTEIFLLLKSATQPDSQS
jgi:hypothetical protein